MVFWHLHFFSLILLMSILTSVNCNGLRCADNENWLFLFSRGTDLILFFCRKHIGLLTSDASGKVMHFLPMGRTLPKV